MAEEINPHAGPLRKRIFQIVFLADTEAGRAFDLVLIVAILASVGVVMLDSVESVHEHYRGLFLAAEWFFTVLFTIEYAVRLAVVRRPLYYARSFYGIVDLLSILPTYISLIAPGAIVLLSVRILRVLRVFRVLKLANYLDEADQLSRALRGSRRKISVFIFVILTLVTVMGSMMYLIEGGENGFDSIPRSVYWAVVTLTTVGYGDISPATPLGQGLALVLMVMGYGIIAVPTGIVTAEMTRGHQAALATRRAETCPTCGLDDHAPDARFCRRCGTDLVRAAAPPEPPRVT
ncbi:ion transporter [Rubrivirga litoralis]|uniref:Ion transporter n=1 Tax=Rubrivirga litoralis TaxID=3075598 RepID=A0ABU3BMW1_9BACT|nr:ion transporter [Rubrivirga sp. F394]MDT0630595.1 ion transporter [Rubrivirga sp. F394]